MTWQFWAIVWTPIVLALGLTIAAVVKEVPALFLLAAIAIVVAIGGVIWAANALNSDI